MALHYWVTVIMYMTTDAVTMHHQHITTKMPNSLEIKSSASTKDHIAGDNSDQVTKTGWEKD